MRQVNLKGVYELKKPVLSLGGFDGIHLGHQALIKRLIKAAKKRQAPSCLVLFDPLPFQVLKGKKSFKRLFTLSELEVLLKEFDLDFLCVIDFDSLFAKLSPKEFIQSVLLPQLDPLHIVAGYDFSFSYQKAGNFSVLQSYGKELGFSVEKAEPYLYKGEPVSSSQIRKYLSEGNIQQVKNRLGRSFFIQSQVLKGEGRGRKLGFPTVNLKPVNKELPLRGVYSARLNIQKEIRPAIVNIGCRPSFDGEQNLVEVHIPDFNRDIYGETLKVELERFIRKERKFLKVSALKAQIKKDIQSLFV